MSYDEPADLWETSQAVALVLAGNLALLLGYLYLGSSDNFLGQAKTLMLLGFFDEGVQGAGRVWQGQAPTRYAREGGLAVLTLQLVTKNCLGCGRPVAVRPDVPPPKTCSMCTPRRKLKRS
jgi:hypothetical protein